MRTPTRLLLALSLLGGACAPGSRGAGRPVGSSATTIQAERDGTGSATVGDRVDPRSFARNNGEGYSGPDFVFDLVPDPSRDNRIAIESIGAAFDACLRSGSFGEQSKSGLLPAGIRLLGQIYGVGVDPNHSRRAQELFPSGTFYGGAFPRFRYESSLSGLDATEDFRLRIGAFRNPLVIDFLPLGRTSPARLSTRLSLPFFLAPPRGEWAFTEEGRGFAKWLTGRAFLYPGESRRLDEPLYDESGEASPYVLNTQDVFECMLGHSQLLVAESRSESPLRDDVAREDLTEWFVRAFSGRYASEAGRLSIAGSGEVEVDVAHGFDRMSCRSRLRGRIEAVERFSALAALDQMLAWHPTMNAELTLTLRFDEVFRDGRFIPLPPASSEPDSCEAKPGRPLTAGVFSRDAREVEGRRVESLRLQLPLLEMTNQGWATGSEFVPLRWLKQDGLIARPLPPPARTEGAQCRILEPWTRNRWNLKLPTAGTLEERRRLYREEYLARRRVARDLFAAYWREGKLDRSIFENCLDRNGERQNFLHTVSVVFWEETVAKMREIQARTGSQALAALLSRHEAAGRLRPPPLFRMTGHRASGSDDARVGGVLQGAPALFLNVFELAPEEWAVIWAHEVSHYLDDELASAITRAGEIADAVQRTEPSRLEGELAERWVRLGLERTYLAEARAWHETFQIYLEVKTAFDKPVPWMERALSFRGAGEPLDRYVRRLLSELNRENLPDHGFLKHPDHRRNAEKIRDEVLKPAGL